jgi:hypothetical protein
MGKVQELKLPQEYHKGPKLSALRRSCCSKNQAIWRGASPLHPLFLSNTLTGHPKVAMGIAEGPSPRYHHVSLRIPNHLSVLLLL